MTKLTPKSIPVKTNRFYQIDLFRFIAAIGIMLAHYLFRGHRADNLSEISFAELGDWMKYFFVFIDLFFIISGFVIALSIRGKSLKEYFKSRVLRVFSVYWICALITFLTIIAFGAPRFTATLVQFLANLTLMHDLVGIESLDGVYWTMVVEVKFYLLSLLYLITLKFKKISIATCAYLWLGLSVIYIFFGHTTIMYLANVALIFEWAPAFIAGMLMADIYKKQHLSTTNIIALLTCIALSMFHRLNYLKVASIHYNVSVSETLVLALILLMYLLVFLVVIGKLRFLNKSIFIYLGILTYPLYLLHQNIGYIIFNNLNEHFNKYLLLTFTILFMLLISYALNRWVEAPITLYLNKVLSHLDKKTRKIRSQIISAIF